MRELDKSPLTIQAYRTDIQQFLTWLIEHDVTVTKAHQVKRSHINEYLRYLANKGRTGTTRARKLVSLQLFFTHLVKEGVIPHSPAATVDRPRKERKPKQYLRPDEYTKLLAAAGGHPRDFALLQLFLLLLSFSFFYKLAFGSVKQSPYVYLNWTWSTKR